MNASPPHQHPQAATDILLVEDSAEDREFALRALRKHDLHSRVALAEDGVIALDLLHRLRQDECTRHLPVVALSSSAEERDIAECYRLGANSYVVKPGDFDAFQHALSSLGKYWVFLNRSSQ